MNKMTVSPWLMVSPTGPVTCAHGSDMQEVHLRQGGLDGACGPYSMVMALITLGVMHRDEALNMYQWDGRSREGKFRDELKKYGSLVSGGTTGNDMLELVGFFSTQGVGAEYVTGSKKDTVAQLALAVDNADIPIVGVSWAGGEGHWMMVVGYQGFEGEGTFQLTHLLCLDPGSETPRASLWNAVIEVFDDGGKSVHAGRLPSKFWGKSGEDSKCRIDDAVIVRLEN